jgi:hypothetical protein
MGRRDILTRSKPVEFHAVIGESALRYGNQPCADTDPRHQEPRRGSSRCNCSAFLIKVLVIAIWRVRRWSD